jgi:probable rRNA maturation factor
MPISVASPARHRGLAQVLRGLVRGTLGLEGRASGEIGVVLSDDETLRALNWRWRGINRATDVMSFGYDDHAGRVSGDLVVSLERMEEQARRFRTGRGRELARLIVHGTLHLAGLDHHREAERRHMRRREAAAMRAARSAIARLQRILDPARR